MNDKADVAKARREFVAQSDQALEEAGCLVKEEQPSRANLEGSLSPTQESGFVTCPLTVVKNAEGTWDILVDGCLTHPRLTQWTKGGAEEIVRLIHEAYIRADTRTRSQESARQIVLVAKAALTLSRAARPLSNFSYNVGQSRKDWDRTPADIKAFDEADNVLHSLEAIKTLKDPITQAGSGSLSQNVPDHSPASHSKNCSVWTMGLNGKQKSCDCGAVSTESIEAVELLPPDQWMTACAEDLHGRMQAYAGLKSWMVPDFARLIAQHYRTRAVNSSAQQEVEAALAELRAMFPAKAGEIRLEVRGLLDKHGDASVKDFAIVWVNSVGTLLAPTLPEAMQKVREWKEQQR